MFLKSPMPEELHQELQERIAPYFDDKAAVVRSSAPSEDSENASFAGLHESYVNIKGTTAILEHIRLVWASLWSDAAILYRQELGLDVATSSMAVVIQEIVHGSRSGVAFSKSPTDASQAVLEAVYGLNQGLVDGIVEPDRWVLDRASLRVVDHIPAQREQYMVPGGQGVHLAPLPQELVNMPPLTEDEALTVFDLAQRAEQFYGKPQDVEWSFKDTMLYVLQSRPITTVSKPDPQDDRRQWDLSLRRSYDNLKLLRKKIEEEEIPKMIEEADRLAEQDIVLFSDHELTEEIQRRSEIFTKWNDIYWADFIPFAHGIRLFGQVYNDAVHPDDPYEFVQLLQSSRLQSLDRNQMLAEMASLIRKNPSLAEKLKQRNFENIEHGFMSTFQQFVSQFGDLSHNSLRGIQVSQERNMLINILLEMAKNPPVEVQPPVTDTETLRKRYLNTFKDDEQCEKALEILELGRVSYQLRDDDNIYLGRIEDQLNRVVDEGRKRLQNRGMAAIKNMTPEDVIKTLNDPSYVPQTSQENESGEVTSEFLFKGRQLIGQPAGPGLAKATARVIIETSDLSKFTSGEILVCDAVDPTMTFVVPLASGIVERRGGMLIHGAIIAREYGLPCVTGVPNVTTLVQTGERITIDGYLGIVTLG
jgi:pyruvate,water dikinase